MKKIQIECSLLLSTFSSEWPLNSALSFCHSIHYNLLVVLCLSYFMLILIHFSVLYNESFYKAASFLLSSLTWFIAQLHNIFQERYLTGVFWTDTYLGMSLYCFKSWTTTCWVFEILLSTLSSTQSFWSSQPTHRSLGPAPFLFLCQKFYMPRSLQASSFILGLPKKSLFSLRVLILTKKRFKLARYSGIFYKICFCDTLPPPPGTSSRPQLICPEWGWLFCFCGGGLADQVCVFAIQGFGHQLGWLKVRV